MCYIAEQFSVISKTPIKLREALTEVRPTFMCAVPRFYEKFILLCLIKSKAPFIRQMIFHWAIAVGQKRFDLLSQNKKSRSSCKNAMRLPISWYFLNCVHC